MSTLLPRWFLRSILIFSENPEQQNQRNYSGFSHKHTSLDNRVWPHPAAVSCLSKTLHSVHSYLDKVEHPAVSHSKFGNFPKDKRSSHLPNLEGVVSSVTNPNFLGWPRPSDSPNPSAAMTEPNVRNLRVISSTVMAGVRPEIMSLLVIFFSPSMYSDGRSRKKKSPCGCAIYICYLPLWQTFAGHKLGLMFLNFNLVPHNA